MKTKLLRITLIVTGLVCITAFTDRPVTLFLIGDSTMANKDTTKGSPERGWGMVLHEYFTDNVRIENHAVNGRSSKSFLDEGRWEKVRRRIQPGDYVLIQFGHNDEKDDPRRHTSVGSTFDANLRLYIRQTRERGGIPVLFNSVVRRNFLVHHDPSIDDESLRNTIYQDEVITSDTLVDTHGQYAEVPRMIARELNVPFVDAQRITHDLEQQLGVEGSRRLHVWYRRGEHPALPEGRQDNTHYNVFGAHEVARLLSTELAIQVPALAPYIKR